jgi:hypothetical protein
VVGTGYELFIYEVKTKNNRLKGILPSTIGYRLVSNFNLIGTERTRIEVLMKFVLAQVIGPAMRIEGCYE